MSDKSKHAQLRVASQVLHMFTSGEDGAARAALIELWDLHIADLNTCALRWCGGNAEDADDAVQDLWVQVERYRRTFDVTLDWGTWVRIILRRLIVRTRVRSQRVCLFDDLIDSSDQWDSVSLSESVPGKKKPDHWVEFCVDFKHCLSKLKKDEQEMIKLRILDGMTVHEIAEVLVLTDNQATTLERRAKARLKNCLEGKSELG